MTTGAMATGAMSAWAAQLVTAAALLAALDVVLVAALVRRLRPIQEALLVDAVVPDPALPQPGTRVAPFAVEAVGGRRMDERVVRSGVYLVGFFASMCLKCDAERRRLYERRLELPLLSFVYNGDYRDKALALARSLAPLGPVAFLSEEVGRAFGHRPESGYPTLMRVEHGVIRAAGHSLDELGEIASRS
jgi:hypothetical protein